MPHDIEILREIVARISTAMQPGGDLETVKRLKVGGWAEVHQHADAPWINVSITELSGNPSEAQNRRVEIVTFRISLFASKLDQLSGNRLFADDETGPLYLFAKLRNVLEKNTSGVVDNTLGGASGDTMELSWEINEDTGLIEFRGTLKIATENFNSGGR